jgi:hypothetical protein
MIEFACDHCVSTSSFLVVVRDDPKSSAYRWYVSNGFESVAKVASYRHQMGREQPTFDIPPTIQVSGFGGPTFDQNCRWDDILSGAATTTHKPTEWKTFNDWRQRTEFHYYSAAYSEHKVFQITSQSFVLLGLSARTEMRNEPRIDILEFVYRGEKTDVSFATIAELAVANLTSDITPTLFWNMNVPEATQLGVADRWESRWQTEILARGLTSDDQKEIAASYWRYRQLDFV